MKPPRNAVASVHSSCFTAILNQLRYRNQFQFLAIPNEQVLDVAFKKVAFEKDPIFG